MRGPGKSRKTSSAQCSLQGVNVPTGLPDCLQGGYAQFPPSLSRLLLSPSLRLGAPTGGYSRQDFVAVFRSKIHKRHCKRSIGAPRTARLRASCNLVRLWTIAGLYGQLPRPVAVMARSRAARHRRTSRWRAYRRGRQGRRIWLMIRLGGAKVWRPGESLMGRRRAIIVRTLLVECGRGVRMDVRGWNEGVRGR